jgi:hypothetical protein
MAWGIQKSHIVKKWDLQNMLQSNHLKDIITKTLYHEKF